MGRAPLVEGIMKRMWGDMAFGIWGESILYLAFGIWQKCILDFWKEKVSPLRGTVTRKRWRFWTDVNHVSSWYSVSFFFTHNSVNT